MHLIKLKRSFICLGIILLAGCNDPQIPNDFIPEEDNVGRLEVIFTVPEFNLLPSHQIHRAILCLAHTPDSLERKEYIDCANLSDVQEDYEFTLSPGVYFYQAAITCSAPGDSCMWGGFPGGRMGLKWTTVRFTIEKSKTTVSIPKFQ